MRSTTAFRINTLLEGSWHFLINDALAIRHTMDIGLLLGFIDTRSLHFDFFFSKIDTFTWLRERCDRTVDYENPVATSRWRKVLRRGSGKRSDLSCHSFARIVPPGNHCVPG
jgi:hypothetical protein